MRARREDVPELAAYLLAKRERELRVEKFKITPKALQMLANHDWQGNVRELENVISYVTALGGNTIDTLPLICIMVMTKRKPATCAVCSAQLSIRLVNRQTSLAPIAVKAMYLWAIYSTD
ncbi:MAG: hypothetical protein WKF71_04800 [Pyrinomonadaceae bacterium]